MNRKETAAYNLATAKHFGDCPVSLTRAVLWLVQVVYFLLSAYIHTQEKILEE